MSDAVRNGLNREALRAADRLVSSRPITHDARKLDGVGDPAPVFLPIKFDRQIHASSYPHKKRLAGSHIGLDCAAFRFNPGRDKPTYRSTPAHRTKTTVSEFVLQPVRERYLDNVATRRAAMQGCVRRDLYARVEVRRLRRGAFRRMFHTAAASLRTGWPC